MFQNLNMKRRYEICLKFPYPNISWIFFNWLTAFFDIFMKILVKISRCIKLRPSVAGISQLLEL